MTRRGWSVGKAPSTGRIHLKFHLDGFPVAERVMDPIEFVGFIEECKSVLAQKPPAPSRKRKEAAGSTSNGHTPASNRPV